MRKSLILCASLLVLNAGSALAAGGVNLGWNDCPSGLTYALNKTFACNTNAGSANILIGSFVAPPNVQACSANEIVVDVQTGNATPALWWSLRASNPPGCRNASFTSSADFTLGPGTCTDYWAGAASNGNSADPSHGKRTRLKGLMALPTGNPGIGPIAEGTEVYSFRFSINNQKTVGANSCGGCTDQACLVLNLIRINQPVA